MKRILTLILGMMMTVSSFALIYDEAREQAWFLTDKMAYELNLTRDQYEAVYQINLEYFLNVNAPGEVMGYYWTYRKMDLQYVLTDWQYSMFTSMSYFLTPMQWTSRWYFPIFSRYRSGYYFYSRPSIFYEWRGGLWAGRRPGGVSPFHDRSFEHNGRGMRDRYDRTPSYNNRAQQGRQGNTYSNNNRPSGGNNGGSNFNGGNNRNSGNYNSGGSGSNNNSNSRYSGGGRSQSGSSNASPSSSPSRSSGGSGSGGGRGGRR